MAPNILAPADNAAIVARLHALTPQSTRLWGSMTVDQMLVHCTDQIRVSIGEKAISTLLPGFVKTIARWMLFNLMPRFPKNMATLKELDPAKEMTPTTNFAQDRLLLLALLDPARYTGRETFEHPAFGNLDREQFGNVVWKHLDHHLRQFGV